MTYHYPATLHEQDRCHFCGRNLSELEAPKRYFCNRTCTKNYSNKRAKLSREYSHLLELLCMTIEGSGKGTTVFVTANPEIIALLSNDQNKSVLKIEAFGLPDDLMITDNPTLKFLFSAASMLWHYGLYFTPQERKLTLTKVFQNLIASHPFPDAESLPQISNHLLAYVLPF